MVVVYGHQTSQMDISSDKHAWIASWITASKTIKSNSSIFHWISQWLSMHPYGPQFEVTLSTKYAGISQSIQWFITSFSPLTHRWFIVCKQVEQWFQDVTLITFPPSFPDISSFPTALLFFFAQGKMDSFNLPLRMEAAEGRAGLDGDLNHLNEKRMRI